MKTIETMEKPTDLFRFRDYPLRWPAAWLLWHIGHILECYGDEIADRTAAAIIAALLTALTYAITNFYFSLIPFLKICFVQI